MGIQLPSPKGTQPPIFGQCPLWLKRLDELGCHLVWRKASAHATLCSMGTHLPPEKEHSLHPILAHVYCGQTARWIKMPLRTEVNLGPGDVVRWGRSSPKMGHSPQFSVHIYCGQTAGWTKTPLGTEVDFWPRAHCVRRGPSSATKGHSSPPLFGPCLLWPWSPISAILHAELLFRFHRPIPRPVV